MHCHERLITGVLRRELNASNVFVHNDGGCSQGGAAKLESGAGVDMDFAGCSYTWLQPRIDGVNSALSSLTV